MVPSLQSCRTDEAILIGRLRVIYHSTMNGMLKRRQENDDDKFHRYRCVCSAFCLDFCLKFTDLLLTWID